MRTSSPSARAGCRCSTSSDVRTSGGWSSRSGPGVFVPRPETELLVDLALRSLAGRDAPVVVDLATGSGAIALAVKAECPTATVYAVELTDLAHAWAVRNRDRLGLEVSVDRGDARHAYPELVDAVDVVTCNPPYIPDDQVPVDPEVRDHDPVEALYGGSVDGLALPLAMAARAAELLRDGGTLVMEHAETQGAVAAAGAGGHGGLGQGHRPRRPAGPAALCRGAPVIGCEVVTRWWDKHE